MMGFALYIEPEVAWCQGTHEYRPMGVAVVAATSVVTPRDFHPRRVLPRRPQGRFAGLFASLGEVNGYLRRRRSRGWEKKLRRRPSRALPIS